MRPTVLIWICLCSESLQFKSDIEQHPGGDGKRQRDRQREREAGADLGRFLHARKEFHTKDMSQ